MGIHQIVIPLATIATAVAGSLVTGANMAWYATIGKPSWTPSGMVISLVWTTLFTLAAAAALQAYEKTAGAARRTVMSVFAVNAVLNAGWSWIFFGFHQIGWAVAEALLLGSSVAALILLLRRPAPLAAWLLSPYLGWTLFAAYLNYIVWSLNT
ncbi:MAG: TspO/MBR family protein [bacterium]|nr:TspO/MBR family protein [bacterium]